MARFQLMHHINKTHANECAAVYNPQFFSESASPYLNFDSEDGGKRTIFAEMDETGHGHFKCPFCDHIESF